MRVAEVKRVLTLLGMIVLLVSQPALADVPGPAPTPHGVTISSVQPALNAPADGILHILYAHQTLDLHTSDKTGEAYVDLSDPGLVRFFNLAGLTVRADAANHAIGLYGGAHYLSWCPNEDHGLVDGNDATWCKAVFAEQDGRTLVSLRAMAQFLNFRLREDANTPATWRFMSRLEKIEMHAQGDREVVIHASGPLDYAQVSNSNQTTRIAISGVEWAFDERSFQFGDVAVLCDGSGADNDPIVVSVNVPVQWRVEPTGRLLQNEIGVRVVPDFQVDVSTPPETLGNLKHFKGIGDYYVMLDASGPVKCMWRYDGGQRLLTVDVPQATVEPIESQLHGEVDRVEAENMKAAAFRFARIRYFIKQGNGFEVHMTEGNRLTVRVAPLPLLPITAMSGSDFPQSPPAATVIPPGPPTHTGRGFVVIDPGHGGSDPGAINHATGMCEKDVTLDIGKRLKIALEARGFSVMLTREDDRDVSWAHSPDPVELGARVHVANANNADLFISIHCNAALNTAHGGTTYHWFKPQDLPLARALEGALAVGTGITDRGLVRNRFFVLRRTTMPAVLVETAFITNPDDASRLADPAIRQKIADDIAEALAVHYPASSASRAGSISTIRP